MMMKIVAARLDTSNVATLHTHYPDVPCIQTVDVAWTVHIRLKHGRHETLL